MPQLVSGTTTNGTWRCTIPIDVSAELGTWTLDLVSLVDIVGNKREVWGEPSRRSFRGGVTVQTRSSCRDALPLTAGRYGEMKPELVAMAARLLLSDDRPLSPGARHDLIVRRGTPASQVTQEQLLWAKQALAALQGAPESDHATVGRAKKVDLKLPRP